MLIDTESLGVSKVHLRQEMEQDQNAMLKKFNTIESRRSHPGIQANEF